VLLERIVCANSSTHSDEENLVNECSATTSACGLRPGPWKKRFVFGDDQSFCDEHLFDPRRSTIVETTCVLSDASDDDVSSDGDAPSHIGPCGDYEPSVLSHSGSYDDYGSSCPSHQGPFAPDDQNIVSTEWI